MLAMLLHRHGYQLPRSFHADALALVTSSLQGEVPGAAAVAGSGSGAAPAAAASALLRPQEAAARAASLTWLLRTLAVLAQQSVYCYCWPPPAAQAAAMGPRGSPPAGPPAAAWQRAADLLGEVVGQPNLSVPPAPGVPQLLQAEAMAALAAVLRVRGAEGAAGQATASRRQQHHAWQAGGGRQGAAWVSGAVAKAPPGLLPTLLGVMHACLQQQAQSQQPQEGGGAPEGGNSGGGGSTAAAAAMGAAPPSARALTWQAAAACAAAAARSRAAQPGGPSSDAGSGASGGVSHGLVDACLAVAPGAVLPPSFVLLHELVCAVAGTAGTAGAAAAARPAGAEPSLDHPLPLDLEPERYPHPATCLPPWCSRDVDTQQAQRTLLVLQRAPDIMAWQEARERVAGAGAGCTPAGAAGGAAAAAGAGPAVAAAAASAAEQLLGPAAAAASGRLSTMLQSLACDGGAYR